MMIHPPILYIGYVGFIIPFAFGIAVLLMNRTGTRWIEEVRRWTLFNWMFLGTASSSGPAGPTWSWAGADTGAGIPSRTPR